jgi:16S rRNA (guanine527-N7)-methyltransferase
MDDLDPKFSILLQELMKWNEHTNLTAIRTKDEIVLKHFRDSLSVLEALPSDATTLIDIGSGAGFPGLPIAIVRPDLEITMVESVQKKVRFIEHVVSTLKLENAIVLNVRAETLAQDKKYHEHFDVAIARAVAVLPTLIEYALPLIKAGGIFIAQKNTGSVLREKPEEALQKYGGNIERIIPIEIAGLSPRELVVIKKSSR